MVGSSIYLRGIGTALPPERISVAAVLRQEGDRYERQMAALTPAFRRRLEAGLGIDEVAIHRGSSSSLALEAVARAVEHAGIRPSEIDAIIDFGTWPGDYPAIWCLANQIQAELGSPRATPLGVHGSGCAGLHLALRVAEAWLRRPADGPRHALLVASDCVPVGGRVSLPVSIMGDAASALVISTDPGPSRPVVRLGAVATTTVGTHHALLRAEGAPPRIEVDAAAFEASILPIHFVMCQRVLQRALSHADHGIDNLGALVYPNTTALDRQSVARALSIPPDRVCGPGPATLGHAFANDLVINLPHFATLSIPTAIGLLAVGSGFTWGASVLHVLADP